MLGLHDNWDKGSYLADRDAFVKYEENPNGTGAYVQPYYDGSIAIGYGFRGVPNGGLVRDTSELRRAA